MRCLSELTIYRAGSTFIDIGYPDRNYKNWTRQYAGMSSGTHRKRVIMAFRIPDWLKNEIVQKVSINVKKFSACYGGDGNYESGMHATLYVSSSTEMTTDRMTYNNYDELIGTGMEESKLLYSSLAEDAIGTAELNISGYDWSKPYMQVTMTGHGQRDKEYLYHSVIYTDPVSITIEYLDTKPTVKCITPADLSVNNATEILFQWEYGVESQSPQSSYEIAWSKDGENWTTMEVQSSETAYTMPANTLDEGHYMWRVRATSADGYTSDYSVGTFTVLANIPHIDIAYPKDINVLNTAAIIVTWSYTEDVQVGQAAYAFQWKTPEEMWRYFEPEYTISPNHYHVISANQLPSGRIDIRVKVKNAYGVESGWEYASFNAVGSTNAPVIIAVSNDPLPVVTWSTDSQDCFEIVIYQGNKAVYESGLCIGADIRQFKCLKMLKDGTYTVQVRAVNSYGLYSAWGYKGFIIESPENLPVEHIDASLNADCIVEIDGLNNANYSLIVRNDAVIAEYDGNTYLDYRTKLNQSYEYCIRAYSKAADGDRGYTTSNSVVVNIEEPDDCVIIHDTAEPLRYVKIDKSSDSILNIKQTDKCTKSYNYCLGREYAQKECGYIKTAIREVTGYVSVEDYAILKAISEHSGTAYYRSSEDAFECDIDITINDKYISGGYLVTVTATRLCEAGEEEILCILS